ncbi:hypothetical protein DAPPUDRAFT_260126 [Daphnia pulex]|uniref:Helicase C-terminal domain-containing protein n=1 Tax=Daphnia pulex TaxID=6669 RepID=E9HIK1_DAPPU|nr:hypothetical protein DAPPUDRAFT_260126 [Daphnia pulex]|eukprot:EFX68447.1 hypothetical protein DAPPUDRAFT_260126 [Daphnia pulex]
MQDSQHFVELRPLSMLNEQLFLISMPKGSSIPQVLSSISEATQNLCTKKSGLLVGILLRKGTNSKPIVGSAAAVHNPTVSAKATKDVTVTVKESCRITKTLNDVLDRFPSYQEMTPTPKIMTTKLYDYQQWGLCWLLWRETESPKGQWEQEIRKHCGSLSVAVYYGALKQRKEMHLTLHTYDIVLTSYGIIKSELSVEENPFSVTNDKTQSILEWDRLVGEESEGFGMKRLQLLDPKVTQQAILVMILRLRQVCSHPALVLTMFEDADSEFTGFDAESWSDTYFHKQNPVFRREKMSTKLKYILDEVQGILSVKEKIVIVSQWTAMLDLIAIQLDNLSIAYQVINGNISANKRTDIILLLSLLAGGTGLNLIGGNHLFLVDPHWNPQLEAQATNRIFRIGQTKSVSVHRIVIQDSIEEKVLALQLNKIATADTIITGAMNNSNANLSLEDIQDMIENTEESE